jgi:DNA repair exonuclease SbcCD ATPase subunit
MNLNYSDGELEREFERYAILLRALEKVNAKVPAELLQAIAAVKNAIDGINLLKKYADDVKDIQQRGELHRIIGELSIELSKAQIQLSQQLRVNDELAAKVERLEKENEELKHPQVSLTFKNSAYYRVEDNDGPFCTKCYDEDRKLIRLSSLGSKFGVNHLRCPSCRAAFEP